MVIVREAIAVEVRREKVPKHRAGDSALRDTKIIFLPSRNSALVAYFHATVHKICGQPSLQIGMEASRRDFFDQKVAAHNIKSLTDIN